MNRMSDAIHIEYEEGGLDMIKAASGLFSITLYDNDGNFDSIHGGGKAYIYMTGVNTYLRVVKEPSWSNWHVVIHTTPDTLKKNPLTFKYFRGQGAIIGVCTLAAQYEETHKEIVRASRYYPMFLTEKTVAVRDADTIFDQYITEIGPREFPKDFTEKLSQLDTPAHREFAERLGHWEQVYSERTRDFTDKVIFSYDSNYKFTESLNRNMTNKYWVGPVKNYKDSKTSFTTYQPHTWHVRFLAGMLTKYGSALPIELWAPGLTNYVPQFIGLRDEKFKHALHYHLLDEYYLADVIYKRCKADNRVAFFYANYVSPIYIEFAKAYFNGRDTDKKPLTPREIAHKNKLQWFIDNPMSSTNPSVHELAIMNPESYHLRPEVFVNPISKYGRKIINMNANTIRNKNRENADRPAWLPSVLFGGSRKTRRRQGRRKRISRKYR